MIYPTQERQKRVLIEQLDAFLHQNLNDPRLKFKTDEDKIKYTNMMVLLIREVTTIQKAFSYKDAVLPITFIKDIATRHLGEVRHWKRLYVADTKAVTQ